MSTICDWYKHFLKNNSSNMQRAYYTAVKVYDIPCVLDAIINHEIKPVYILAEAAERNDIETVKKISPLYQIFSGYTVTNSKDEGLIFHYEDEDIIPRIKNSEVLSEIYSKRNICINPSSVPQLKGHCLFLCSKIPDEDKENKMKCWDICEKINIENNDTKN